MEGNDGPGRLFTGIDIARFFLEHQKQPEFAAAKWRRRRDDYHLHELTRDGRCSSAFKPVSWMVGTPRAGGAQFEASFLCFGQLNDKFTGASLMVAEISRNSRGTAPPNWLQIHSSI